MKMGDKQNQLGEIDLNLCKVCNKKCEWKMKYIRTQMQWNPR